MNIKNFSPDELSVKSKAFISHLRYATSGNKDKIQDYTQPFHSSNKLGSYSLAHNGNIPNIKTYDTQFILDMILNTNIHMFMMGYLVEFIYEII